METTKQKQLEKLEVINNIRLTAEDYYITDKEFKLTLVSEGIVTYVLDHNDLSFEINIIADDDFFKEETIEEILNTKRIKYIGLNVYRMESNLVKTVMFSENA